MSDTFRFNSPDNHDHYHFSEETKGEQPKGIGTLSKLAIGAGLLGTGIGTGVGIPLILDAMSSKPNPQVSVETNTETIDWKLGTPIVE